MFVLLFGTLVESFSKGNLEKIISELPCYEAVSRVYFIASRRISYSKPIHNDQSGRTTLLSPIVLSIKKFRSESNSSRKSMNVMRVKSAYKCLPGCRICASNQQFDMILYFTRNSSGLEGIEDKNRRLVCIVSWPSRWRLICLWESGFFDS